MLLRSDVDNKISFTQKDFNLFEVFIGLIFTIVLIGLLTGINTIIDNCLSYYNKLLKQYKTENNENILKEAITNYIESTIPLMEQKFEVKYQNYTIENKKEDGRMKKVVYSQFVSDFNKEILLEENNPHKILINNK